VANLFEALYAIQPRFNELSERLCLWPIWPVAIGNRSLDVDVRFVLQVREVIFELPVRVNQKTRKDSESCFVVGRSIDWFMINDCG
jgi:hypothetical protein